MLRFAPTFSYDQEKKLIYSDMNIFFNLLFNDEG